MLTHSREAPSLVARTPTEDERAWLDLRKLGQCREEPPAPERTGRPWDMDQEAVVPPAPLAPLPHPCLGSQAGNLIFSFVLGPG